MSAAIAGITHSGTGEALYNHPAIAEKTKAATKLLIEPYGYFILPPSFARAVCAGSLQLRSLPLSGHRSGCCDPKRLGLRSGVRAGLSSASWPNPEHRLRGLQGRPGALPQSA